MFVASGIYKYATGSSTAPAAAGSTNLHTRVKRRPNNSRNKKTQGVPDATHPTSPPPSYASVAGLGSATSNVASANAAAAQAVAAAAETVERTAAEKAKMRVIDEIIETQDLYDVLGVKKNAKPEEIRRGFLARSRVCHPDKFPSYAPCISAFQRVSLAYQTLSSPSSRRMYDVSGRADFAAAVNDGMPPGAASDETLNGVLYSVFCEFLDGDFEMIRVLINAMNEGSPGLALGDDAVDSIEGAFKRLRGMMLAGKKYLGIIRFELIRLYEIQQSLRQLSYFDVFGRLRLTLQLARVTLSIPMAIDSAMKAPEEGEASAADANATNTAAGTTEEQDYSSSSSDSEDDDEEVQAHDRAATAASAAADFGIAAEEPSDDESDDDGLRQRDAQRRRASHKTQKRARRRARRRVDTGEVPPEGADAAGEKTQHRRRRRKETNDKALQKRGLLGPTAVALLGGVVKVLETSENWVPGSRGAAVADD